nr:unnamed protein product [Digitaria exilis]
MKRQIKKKEKRKPQWSRSPLVSEPARVFAPPHRAISLAGFQLTGSRLEGPARAVARLRGFSLSTPAVARASHCSPLAALFSAEPFVSHSDEDYAEGDGGGGDRITEML